MDETQGPSCPAPPPLYFWIPRPGAVLSSANTVTWVLPKDFLQKKINKVNFSSWALTIGCYNGSPWLWTTSGINLTCSLNEISIHQNYSFCVFFFFFFQARKTKTTAKINKACSSSIQDQEQHVHKYVCLPSALFLNISLLQRPTLRQENVSQLPGDPAQETEYQRRDFSQGFLCSVPWQTAACQVFIFSGAWRNLSN